MNIGAALNRLFTGVTVDITVDNAPMNRALQFHYGDHKELVKFIMSRTKGSVAVYPLLWYVVAPYTEQSNNRKLVNSKLIILNSIADWQKQYNWLNDIKSIKSYDSIIEPVWDKVKSTIIACNYIDVLGKTSEKFIIKDEPNYGVETDGIRISQTDFRTEETKGDKSIVPNGMVDGRIIELKFIINTKCI
jgi:hypothetical protein